MSSIDSLAAALYSACLRDLPDAEFVEIDHATERVYLDALTHDQRRAYFELKPKEFSVDDESFPEAEEFFRARGIALKFAHRRPTPQTCEVIMFRQVWGSTALGYGGVGGQAMTNADTVIVISDLTGHAAVYFGGGRLAYIVPPDKQGAEWYKAIQIQKMPACEEAARKHGWYHFVSRVVDPGLPEAA